MVLYRQTRRNDPMLFRMERDFLCVCTPETLALTKASKFSESFVAAQVVSKSDVLRWCSPRTRATRFLRSPNLFTIPNIMFGLLSRISISTALKRFSQNHVRAGRQSSPRTTEPSSPKPPSARLTFSAVRLSDGLLRSFANIWLPKRSFLRSALRRFGLFCTTTRSNSGGRKPGKNATTRSLSLKKTDSQIYKPACVQWSDHLVRRIWSSGDSPSARSGVVPYRSSKETASNVYASSWRSALAGILRRSSEEVVGICSTSQTASGIPRRIEALEKKVPEASKDSFDPRQLLTAPQRQGSRLLSQEQYSLDLDADQRVMAQSYRMSVYSCKRIRDSRHILSKPRRTKRFTGQIRQIPKQTNSTKVKLIKLKRH